MYSRYLNQYLRMRKKATAQGIPDWALLHADRCVDKAAWCRKRAIGKRYAGRYSRALNELMAGINTMYSFLYRQAYQERIQTPNLQEVLDAKQQARDKRRAKREQRAGCSPTSPDGSNQPAG